MATIKEPFGAADTSPVINATGTTTLNITNTVTVVRTLTTLTGNATLDLVISPEVREGALIHLKVRTTAVETFTFGAGIDSVVVTGVAGKTWTQSFYYDGTVFLPCGTRTQID
jgi:hypothetical protein